MFYTNDYKVGAKRETITFDVVGKSIDFYWEGETMPILKINKLKPPSNSLDLPC